MQVGTHQYGVGFTPNRIGMEMGYEPHPTLIPDGTKMDRSSMDDRIFKPREYDRLSESVIKRIVSENEHHEYAKMNHGEFMNEIDSLCEEASMIEDANCSKINDMEHKWNLLDRAHNSHGVDRSDKFMLCGAKIRRFKKNRCTPRETDRSSMEARIFKPREYDRLHESDLTRIVKRVISEQPATPVKPATTNVKPA